MVCILAQGGSGVLEADRLVRLPEQFRFHFDHQSQVNSLISRGIA
jgi:hypothetical protein